MLKGCLLNHLGWTDIFNSLPIINYYSKIYDYLYVLTREDAQDILQFYTKNISNVKMLYLDKKIIDNSDIKGFDYLIHNINNKYSDIDFNVIDFLGIGCWEKFGNRVWLLEDEQNRRTNGKTDIFFCKNFYTKYGIPYNLRVDNFIFVRDLELEEITYQNFIKKHGKEYILYHEVIENQDKHLPCINLNKISNIYFDMIKILENAIEIHLLDSSWGAFIYLLDAKYNLFTNKKIYLYARRGYTKMFTEPIKLNNWKII